MVQVISTTQDDQTPKTFERKRQDENAPVLSGHTCDHINSSMNIPSKWCDNVVM